MYIYIYIYISAQEAGGVRHLGRLGWQSSDRHTAHAAGYAAGPGPPGGVPWRCDAAVL